MCRLRWRSTGLCSITTCPSPGSSSPRFSLHQDSLHVYVGIALAQWRPIVDDTIARIAHRLVGMTVIVVVVVVIFATWRSLLSFGAGVWLTCLTVATVAVLTGQLVGGP